VHYLNQFFGGFGGEEVASLPPQVLTKLPGPSRLLQQLLGTSATVVATLVCGDNYLNEEEATALRALGTLLDEQRADVLVAGPAFNAGRYGVACAAVCQLAADRGMHAVAGMHPDNPGAPSCAENAYVVPTGMQATGMADALTRMAGLGRMLADDVAVGPAAEVGYLPRGVRLNVLNDLTAADRAVRLLHTRLRGEAYSSEIPLTVVEAVEPAPPLEHLHDAVIAIVTEAGVVPAGNPSRLSHAHADHWTSYTVAGLDELPAGDFQGVHGGFDNRFVNDDPDRAVPVDMLRRLERDGVIGSLHDTVFVTVGNGTPVPSCARFGQEIAAELVAAEVGGVIVPST
jgi:betaine reductase